MKQLLLFTLGMFFVSSSLAEAKLGTKQVLIDNDTVEVVRLTYPAGSESGIHTHKYPNRVAYFIKGGKLQLIPADKNSPPKVIDASDGTTLFLPATTHNVKNVGNTEIILVETEIK